MSFCLKQEQISLNEARKMNLIQRENKILFLTQLPDIFSCFKQKLNLVIFFRKQNNNFASQIPILHVNI